MCDAIVKIIPIGIEPFDLPHLPSALPVLHPPLALTSGFPIAEHLEPDETLAAISLREPSATPLRCSHTRFARFTVDPRYKVPFLALAMI